MEKQVICNYELGSMIRGFVGVRVGTGYATRIDEILEKIRPNATQDIPISVAEAAGFAVIVITQIENQTKA